MVLHVYDAADKRRLPVRLYRDLRAKARNSRETTSNEYDALGAVVGSHQPSGNASVDEGSLHGESAAGERAPKARQHDETPIATKIRLAEAELSLSEHAEQFGCANTEDQLVSGEKGSLRSTQTAISPPLHLITTTMSPMTINQRSSKTATPTPAARRSVHQTPQKQAQRTILTHRSMLWEREQSV